MFNPERDERRKQGELEEKQRQLEYKETPMAQEILPENIMQQLSPQQQNQLSIIASHLCGGDHLELCADTACLMLQRLGFTFWRFKKGGGFSVVMIEGGNEMRALPALRTVGHEDAKQEITSANTDDPFGHLLGGLYKIIPFPGKKKRLIRGSRGGFSFDEIDSYILPEFARRMGISRERLRLPTYQECYLIGVNELQDPRIEEYFSDRNKQPEIDETALATLETSMTTRDRVAHCMSEDRATLERSKENKHNQQKLKPSPEILRGNLGNVDFVHSDNYIRNSYFRCLVQLTH
ncbi:MAG: hypothetical protein AAB739_00930 [Patescibacteria group bacterium]